MIHNYLFRSVVILIGGGALLGGGEVYTKFSVRIFSNYGDTIPEGASRGAFRASVLFPIKIIECSPKIWKEEWKKMK